MNKFKEIYYKPENMWHGYSAINKLADLAQSSNEEAENWLSKQTMWQIYLPKPQYIARRKITTQYGDYSIPNAIHQIDLLFMPADKVGRRTFKYILSVVDVASRYKEAEPLTSKYSNEVAKALTKIYKRSKLTWPKGVQMDAGREFMGEFTDLMKSHNVDMVRIKPNPGSHRKQAIVERFNRTLAEKLFTPQLAKEILALARHDANQAKLSEFRNTEWVRNLPAVVANLNKSKTRLISMTPDEAITKDKVYSKSSLPPKEKLNMLELGSKVRYLLEPGELEHDTRRRATDPVWSIDAYVIESAFKNTDGLWIYRLNDVPKRSFVNEELQIIPYDTELPPEL